MPQQDDDDGDRVGGETQGQPHVGEIRVARDGDDWQLQQQPQRMCVRLHALGDIPSQPVTVQRVVDRPHRDVRIVGHPCGPDDDVGDDGDEGHDAGRGQCAAQVISQWRRGPGCTDRCRVGTARERLWPPRVRPARPGDVGGPGPARWRVAA